MKQKKTISNVMDPYKRERHIVDNTIIHLAAAAGSNSFIKKFDKKYDRNRKIDRSKEDGIFFNATRGGDSGHFVARKNGQILNSYDLGQQERGGNGFCQTYACMNYAGEPLSQYKKDNNVLAMQFLRKHAATLKKGFAESLEDNDFVVDMYNNPTTKEIQQQIDKALNYHDFDKVIEEEGGWEGAL